jgi:hypothetical protein
VRGESSSEILMSAQDFRINAYVRQVLSRCWVNAKTIRFGAIGEVVYFHGRFEKMRAPDSKNTEPWEERLRERTSEDLVLLETVEEEVRREPKVKDVVFSLENFRKVQGKWVPTGA